MNLGAGSNKLETLIFRSQERGILLQRKEGMSILNITEESGEVKTKKLLQWQLGHCDFSRNNFILIHSYSLTWHKEEFPCFC